jgi:hypothetical protein
VLGQAIDYALKRWEALAQFLNDGFLEIANNLIENAIRPSALGKKLLFIRHPHAGERSAVIYTLPGSCRRHGLDPFDYLKDLFTVLPAAKITQIKSFTPAAWARAKAKEQLVAQARYGSSPASVGLRPLPEMDKTRTINQHEPGSETDSPGGSKR